MALVAEAGPLLCCPPFVGQRRGQEGVSPVDRFLMGTKGEKEKLTEVHIQYDG